MPTNLLVLPLLSGFYFLHQCHRFRFRAQTLDGYRLIIQSAYWAVLFLFLGRLLTFALGYLLPLAWLQWWTRFAPIDFLGTGLCSLGLGPIAGMLWNRRLDEEEERDRAIEQYGDSFLNLLRDAEVQDELVSITLSSRKFYVGYVAGTTDLRPSEKYFRILPILSGYRHPERLTFEVTVNYADLVRDPNRDPGDLVIVLPLSEVRSANLFDEKQYADHFRSPPAETIFEKSDLFQH